MLGLPVISAHNGDKIGIIKDVVFDREDRSAKAYILEKGSYTFSGRVAMKESILNVGEDAVIIDCLKSLKDYKKFKHCELMKKRLVLRGFKIYTRSGKDLGSVNDILFDQDSGVIEAIIVSDGLFQDIFTGRSTLPLIGKIEIGNDSILVEEEAAAEMTNNGGGLLKRLQRNEI